ncbi:MAG: hypothetical protein ACI8RD_004488 [Bacillariaceae sp.]|jgi:hypothetical protein
MTYITAIQGFESMVFRLVECHDVGGVEVENTSIHKQLSELGFEWSDELYRSQSLMI